jgi:putative membrane protein
MSAAEIISSSGFLPARGSFMLDFVVVAMALIVLVMAFSIWIVRRRRNYLLHKRIQIGTAIVLFVAIVAFEVDLRLLTDWRTLAASSRFAGTGLIEIALYVHLCFAIPAPFIWAITLFKALRHFPNPPRPVAGKFSRQHRMLGWLSVCVMTMTAVTGWIFYAVAFVA